jgi:paraquat-inducible protein B
MSRSPTPWRVGVFVIGGIALLVVSIATVLGGQLFTRTDRVVMHFEGSVYGLQVGSPVVFRGVRLGNVVAVGLDHDAASGRISIPVTADLERRLVADMQGVPPGGGTVPPLAALVERGLTARLATQSLLTGLLYVDLDLRPLSKEAVKTAAVASALAGGPVEIPTMPTAFQALQSQLEGIDLGALVKDVAAVAAATRKFVDEPALKQALADLGRLSAELRQLTARLDRRVDPLADGAQQALAEARRAAGSLGSAADKLGTVATRVDGFMAPDAALGQGLQSIRRAADELAKTAAALRGATGDDAALVQGLERAASDVSRAARAVRELAEQLESQPESLIRGRPASP